MFTCPENDIHSIYLDGELPGKFTAEYEAHLLSCEKCRAKLERLRATHELLSADAASLDLNGDFMEKSFERLQGQMRFKKIVAQSESKGLVLPIRRTLIPMAAAAAAVFMIMTPQRTNTAQDANISAHNLQMISKAQEITPISENGVIAEGGIQEVALSKTRGQDSSSAAVNAPPLELKASKFEMLKSEDDEGSGMTIRLTELSKLNSLSAENVSFDQFHAPVFQK